MHANPHPGPATLTSIGEPTHRPSGFLPSAVWRQIGEVLGLSEREFQVACCVVDGDSEAAIARRLQISPFTVHTHLERLYRKLGVGNRCALVVCLFATYVRLHPASPGAVLAGAPRPASEDVGRTAEGRAGDG